MRTTFSRVLLAASLVAAAAIGGCAGGPNSSMTPDTVAAGIAGRDMPALRDTWRTLGIYDSDSFRAAGVSDNYRSGPFSARVFHLEIDGRNDAANGTDAVVRIGDPAEWDWQYLVFASRPAGWKFLGKIDLPGNRLVEPVPESVVMGPGQAWLVVRSLRAGNETSAEYESRWFAVRNDQLVEVLRVPASGRRAQVDLPFSVTYRAELVDTFFTRQNQPALAFRIEATYTTGDPGSSREPLFEHQGIARFVQSATGKFNLDPSNSEWTQGQLAGLAADGPDEFLLHNARWISELARSDDPAKRLWVGRLLAQCRDSAQKEQIVSEMGEIRE